MTLGPATSTAALLIVPLELLLLVLSLHRRIVVSATDGIGIARAAIEAFGRGHMVRKIGYGRTHKGG